MMPVMENLRGKLSALHAEALQVGDSPLRADMLAERVARLAREVAASDAGEELRARLGSALADAERVLRRDDDGREAARHLQAALRHAEGSRPRHPNPFGDDD